LDAVKRGKVFGWAWEPASSEPTNVELLVDAQVVAVGRANLFRPDLEQAGIGDGHAGFAIEIPPLLCDLKFHEVAVRAGRNRIQLNGSPRVEQLVGPLNEVEFFAGGTWIDSDDATFEAGLARLRSAESLNNAELQQFRDFRRDGYVWLRQVVDPSLIDAVERDISRLWRDRPNMLTQSAGEAPRQVRTVEDERAYRARSARYLDFHNLSEATAAILCHPVVVRFVRRYLGEPIAGMQTLLFENGTQQRAHQDYPYVHSLRPAALAGAWVALEKVSENAGPLFYFAGSHRAVRPYAFDGGSVLAEGDGEHIRLYERYLEETCAGLGLRRETLLAERGDVLIWHSALVHGGSARKDLTLTRRSLVSHYTTQAAYPFDRRTPSMAPIPIRVGDCVYYANQQPDHVEGAFKLRQSGGISA
jgi:ectoine hydroxylase-related dioxygenase (phytanoyl-CoA dioxygenase family)